MKHLNLSLLFLFLSFTVCKAQYNEWTYIRPLPSQQIEAFEILSDNELLVLDDGILYYSDDQGFDWRILVETDSPINSMVVDKEGYFYYKNAEGLFKQRIDEERTTLINGFGTFTLDLVKNDTIVLHSNVGLHYSLNLGQTWTTIQFVNIDNSSTFTDQDIQLKDGLIHHIKSRITLRTYNINTGEQANFSIDNSIQGDDLAWYFANSNGPTIIDYFRLGGGNNFQGQYAYLTSTDNSTTSPHVPTGIPLGSDIFTSKIFEGKYNDLIRISFKSNLNETATIHVSTDQGYNWSSIKTDSLTIDVYPEFRTSVNSSYAYALSGGRLYRTKNKITDTNNLDQSSISTIKLSPNPTNSHFKIEMTGQNNPISVSIYNLHGQLIKSYHKIYPEQELSLDDYSDGVYLVQIVDSEGITHSQQVVKSQQ